MLRNGSDSLFASDLLPCLCPGRPSRSHMNCPADEKEEPEVTYANTIAEVSHAASNRTSLSAPVLTHGQLQAGIHETTLLIDQTQREIEELKVLLKRSVHD